MSNPKSQKSEVCVVNMHLSFLRHDVVMCALREPNGMAYKVPWDKVKLFLKDQRKQYKDGETMQEFRRREYCIDKSCVYMLLKDGVDNEEGSIVVYVGETENVSARRFVDHHVLKKMGAPQYMLIFCRTDYDFNKGHLEHIERGLIDILRQQENVILVNGRVDQHKVQGGSKSADKTLAQINLCSQDQKTADGFVQNIVLMTKAFGYNLLDFVDHSSATPVKVASDAPRFFIKQGSSQVGEGQPIENGFIVFHGAKMSLNEVSSCRSNIKALRSKLKEEGIVDIKTGKFVQDYVFTYPSNAAGVIKGDCSDGNTVWKTEKGETLGDWRWQNQNVVDTTEK
jgi:hypothetical protein